MQPMDRYPMMHAMLVMPVFYHWRAGSPSLSYFYMVLGFDDFQDAGIAITVISRNETWPTSNWYNL